MQAERACGVFRSGVPDEVRRFARRAPAAGLSAAPVRRRRWAHLLPAWILVLVVLSVAFPPPALAQSGTTYVVQAGDSLAFIAAKHLTTVAVIMQANGLTNSDPLYVGQRLFVPGPPLGGLVVAASSSPAEMPARYTVRAGDTLYGIARAQGVTVGDLTLANNLTTAAILHVGQTLILPQSRGQRAAASGSTNSPPAPAPAPAPAASRLAPAPAATLPLGATLPRTPEEYIVQPGDTLSGIAQQFGTTTAGIVDANKLVDANVLSAGQRLTLPTGASGARSAAPALLLGALGQQAVENPAPPAQLRHVLQSGETLEALARQFNTTAAAIAHLNNLTDPAKLNVGTPLAIPAPDWSAPFLTGPVSRFVASISQQHCWLYRGSDIIASWTCSTGRAGSDTVPGSYRIQSKMEKGWGGTWNIWLPYWLGIYWAGALENGIHGIPYYADAGSTLWEDLVGTPISYGCVLLDDEHAKQLYDVAYIGMPVIIQP